MGSSGVFKATSGNAAKRLKMRPETRVAREGKTARHTNDNSGASNGENADGRVEAKVMGEVVHQIYGIRQI